MPVEATPTPATATEMGPRRRRLVVAMAAGAAVAAGTLAAVVTASPADAVPAPAGSCAAVSIVTARASTEAPGEGITGALVSQVVNQSRQTVSRASVSYPATLGNYAASQAQGVAAAKTQVTNLVNRCPTTKVVLLGYSQGANVIGDILAGGGGGALGAQSAPLGSNITSHVAAIVTFGDPRHVRNQPSDLGTSVTNGLFPRSGAQLQRLGAFANVYQAYCDLNDTFCASGIDTITHLTYLNRYQNAAASFILGRVGG
jgi:acetylxylan esterase